MLWLTKTSSIPDEPSAFDTRQIRCTCDNPVFHTTMSPGSIFCGILSQETHARRSLVKLQWKTLGFTISQIFWTFKKAPAQIKSVKRGMGVGGRLLAWYVNCFGYSPCGTRRRGARRAWAKS